MLDSPTKITLQTIDLAKLADLARRVADQLRPGDAIILSGVLAAGKTQFIKLLSEFLEITDIVTSPTFTLVHFYQGGRLPLIHVDAYRLESHAEYLDLTLEDFLENHAIVIEWGDKFRDVLPPALDITLFPEDAVQRTVTLSSSVPHRQEVISNISTQYQNSTE